MLSLRVSDIFSLSTNFSLSVGIREGSSWNGLGVEFSEFLKGASSQFSPILAVISHTNTRLQKQWLRVRKMLESRKEDRHY